MMLAWTDQHPASFALALFAMLALFWIGVSLVISRAGGWHALAGRFRFEEKFSGVHWRWQSAQMRWIAAYHNCVTIGASPEGLYVAPFFPFRLAHPPLFIPWSEVSYSRKKVMFTPMVCFELGRDQSIPFWVRENLGQRLQQAADGAWPAESPA
ncbi:MAG TPA: hypothetical protein VNF02_01225 [Candidatus Limnocylindrales bacterium]|nr:hypothetical protein [Candidatus Limnocylindrales bacterium]